jgi:hypothetical protein
METGPKKTVAIDLYVCLWGDLLVLMHAKRRERTAVLERGKGGEGAVEIEMKN